MGIMTDRKIEIVAVEKLKPHPKNPYKHSADQLKLLAKSISEYQWTVPIIANKDGTILSGHARVEVAKFLKRETVPVIYVDFTEKQALAYLICDNELTKKAELDFTLFADDILELDTGDFDINLVGLTDIDVEQAMTWAGKNSVVEDEAPPIPVKAKSKLGDIYELGNHRVMCADCTVKENIDKLMAGKKADMVMTSPPYWIGKEYEQEKSEKEIDIFIAKLCDCIVGSMSDKASRIIINTGTGWRNRIEKTDNVELMLLADKYINNFKRHNWLCRHIRIWGKRGSLPATAPHPDYIDMHWEFIMTFYNFVSKYRGQNKLNESGKSWALDALWEGIQGNANQEGHTASFPVEIPRRNIILYSNESEIIYEPFAGVGTTLIACEQTKRVCYGMEIDPLYIDVIVSRYCNFVDNNKVIKNGKEMLW